MADEKSGTITSMMEETRRFPPSEEFVKQAYVKSREQYEKMWKESIETPEKFWGAPRRGACTGSRNGTRSTRRTSPRATSSGSSTAKPTSLTTASITRSRRGYGDKVAIIFQGEPDDDVKKLTYKELLKQVSRFANVLKKKGVKKGDRVAIYLPMIAELPIAMMACARIGAIHTIVFGGFSGRGPEGQDPRRRRDRSHYSERLLALGQTRELEGKRGHGLRPLREAGPHSSRT